MSLTVQISKPWHIKTPVLYRYMDQVYIDEFFETGRLRLSTFATFAKHEDEQRHDNREGDNVIVSMGEGHTIVARTQHGHRSLIFCASTIADEELMRDFGCDGYFRIKDSTAFGAHIASKLPGFRDGLEGMCSYVDRRRIEGRVEEFSLDHLKNDSGQMDLGKVASHVFQVGGAEVFFVKLKQYSAQSEYRFVWNLMIDVEDAMFVECPEARQFCEKVT